MSRLTTAPNERLGVRTYVKEYDDKVIKEIILREQRRGGQIFYVHNNIASMEAKKYNLFVIEDAAEAHGAEENGRKVGGLGDAGVFSFYGNKIMTSGEGGMITEEIKELYEKLKSAILNLDNLEIKPKKVYVAFVAGRNVVDILPQRKALKIWLNMSKGELDDPKGIAKDVSTTGHWGNGDYEIKIQNDDDLEYILSLIKQSLKKNKK